MLATQHIFASHHTQADPQDFERLLMVKPLLTVNDLRTADTSSEPPDAEESELLRNYCFNISQGIIQRVSRFFDQMALVDKEAATTFQGETKTPAARNGEGAGQQRGGVMQFEEKRRLLMPMHTF